ncbi:MAG: chromate transporter [Casimicrobiaceae bacterium]
MTAIETPPSSPAVSLRELFFGFLKVGLSGFGGVLPFARRMLVEERRWLTANEFNEVLALSQFLPGPNIVNVSVIVGRRFQRVPGSIVASVGLMLMPLVILLVLATLYAQFAQLDVVQRVTHGVSAAAAGLVVSVALKMGQPLRKSIWKVVIALIAFAAIGLARLPLLWVLAVLAPVSFAIAWRQR